jgi:predicted transcriptional regulator
MGYTVSPHLEVAIMSNDYQSLSYGSLPSGTLISNGRPAGSVDVSLDDAAISMMTDFSHTRPFATTANTSIEDIDAKMIACGVRLLFVAERDEVLLGLVTYNDIYGEKPLQYIREHGGKREEITALDIMTPMSRLESLQLSDISRARVGDIVETMKTSGRQHVLVSEEQTDGSQTISGMFSSTQIEKQLKIKIELSPRANTFADLERALT